MPTLKQVHLPYRGVISSQELQQYFNSILNDISQVEERIKQIESTLSGGYVFGCRLEYNKTTSELTVNDGFFYWNGELKFVTKLTTIVQLEDGDIVHIDPQDSGNQVKISKVILQDCVPLGQYVGSQFSYSVRTSFQAIDDSTLRTRILTNELTLESVGKHLDIAYQLSNMNMQMYSQSDQTWHFVARPQFVAGDKLTQDAQIPLEGMQLFSNQYVFGQFQPCGVIFTYRSVQQPTNQALRVTLDGVQVNKVLLQQTTAKTIDVPFNAGAGYRTLSIQVIRDNGQFAGVLPQDFQYSVYVKY